MNRVYNEDNNCYCYGPITTSTSSYSYPYYVTLAPNTPINFKFGGGYIVGGEHIYIKEVKYNNPVTIIFWSDNTKTVSKCYDDDIYNPETGLAICVLKKLVGGKKVKLLMDDWLPEESQTEVTLKDVRKRQKRD